MTELRMTERPPGGTCDQCQHPMDPHVFATTGSAPLEGGIILCPVIGCPCYGTWSVGGLPTLRIPDEAEIAAMRADVQIIPTGT